VDVLAAIDRIDDLVHVPYWGGVAIRPDFKKVDPVRYAEALDRLRIEVESALVDPERLECLALVEQLDGCGRKAKRIPVIGGIAIRRAEVLDVLDALRQAVPRGIIARRARD
jgi:hypothetical protein